VASYGEEARVHLDRARALKKTKELSSKHKDYGQEIAAAVRLYAEQAAHGSGSGIDSLRIVAYEVLGDEAAVEASICDPIVQQLLIDRLLTDYASPPSFYPGYSGDYPNSQLAQVVSATQGCEVHLAKADQLAAIAYRSGDYHLAQRIVAQATGPLASWVRARLAMQQGNNAEAAKNYAEASNAFPTSIEVHSADAGTKALLVGQNSVLTLSRGEYIDALEQLSPYAATFWGDVAYIAERVLTVDELKTFVDTHNDTQAQPEISLANLPEPVGVYASDYGSNDVPNPFGFGDGRGPTAHLRDLLARRLVRAGRYQEALKYFPPSEEKTSTPSDYAQALADANTEKSNTERARTWYRAATLAGDFKSGNQIMGTEGPLDNYAEPSLSYCGIGRFKLRPDDRFVTKDERQRFAASAPKPNFRYHYLFVGVDEALRAADLLPPRSQAFAAVLCHATRWMIDGKLCPASAASLRDSATAYGWDQPNIADPLTLDTVWSDERTARINLTCQLYQHYLKEGAVVPWATHFGRHCPDPDFDSAVSFTQRQEIREARRDRQVAHYHRITALKLAAILGCWALATWWFLRHRYA
jgi:tetratricopeptide (TPR) repeat protein